MIYQTGAGNEYLFVLVLVGVPVIYCKCGVDGITVLYCQQLYSGSGVVCRLVQIPQMLRKARREYKFEAAATFSLLSDSVVYYDPTFNIVLCIGVEGRVGLYKGQHTTQDRWLTARQKLLD